MQGSKEGLQSLQPSVLVEPHCSGGRKWRPTKIKALISRERHLKTIAKDFSVHQMQLGKRNRGQRKRRKKAAYPWRRDRNICEGHIPETLVHSALQTLRLNGMQHKKHDPKRKTLIN